MKFNEMTHDPAEVVDVDFSNLPEQFSARDPLPQPARNVIVLIPRLDPSMDLFDEEVGEGMTKRVVAMFGGKDCPSSALRVLHSPVPEDINHEFRWRCSNSEKKWDEASGASSQMAYLLTALDPGIDLTRQGNAAYLNALIALSGRPVKVNTSWTAACNPKNDIYVKDVNTGSMEKQANVKGCGQRYGMSNKTIRQGKNAGTQVVAIPQAVDAETGAVIPGRWQERFTCVTPGCDAEIGCFIDLGNLRPLTAQDYALIDPAIWAPEELEGEGEAAQEPVQEPEPAVEAAPTPAPPSAAAPVVQPNTPAKVKVKTAAPAAK